MVCAWSLAIDGEGLLAQSSLAQIRRKRELYPYDAAGHSF
ncbi:hypothetical protein EKH55_5740 (plasmid) [Sinorhizobium alkalisoli]|nr:hypothetical protein EKH55_5740 [Sinorhizobium alkalisoli]